MELSLHAARNGIAATVSQQNIIANNLANLTTTAFKKGRQEQATFRVPGTQVASTQTDFTQGTVDDTGRDLDLAIQGDGFFKINFNGLEAYTRSGALRVDRDGNLVTHHGYLIDPPVTIPQDALRVQVTTDGRVLAMMDLEGTLTEVGTIEAVRFQNPLGLVSLGDSLFKEGPDSGSALSGEFGEDGFPNLVPRALEESNVQLADELTHELITQRAFQANMRAFRVSDQLISDTINLLR